MSEQETIVIVSCRARLRLVDKAEVLGGLTPRRVLSKGEVVARAAGSLDLWSWVQDYRCGL